MPTHLDLCSGIGGFALAAHWAGFRTVGFCEIDEYCRKVLGRHWPEVTCFEDVRTFDGKPFRGVDLLTAGFPCQDISIAGKGEGLDGERSRLWFDCLRVIRECRPSWIVIENSPRLRLLGVDRIIGGLEEAEYACWPVVVGADHAGACHKRRRVWLVAHAESREDHERGTGILAEACAGREGGDASACSCGEDAHNALRGRHRPQEAQVRTGRVRTLSTDWWAFEPRLLGVDDGIPNRVERVAALGNSIVPQVVYPILRWIREQIAQ